MRLPFVSRLAYDTLQCYLKTIEDAALAREKQWECRYDTLLARFTEATKKPDAPVVPERTRDEVIDAIMARAGSNGQIRAHLSAWAAKQRRAQVPDDQIINQILVWASPDEDDSPNGMP